MLEAVIGIESNLDPLAPQPQAVMPPMPVVVRGRDTSYTAAEVLRRVKQRTSAATGTTTGAAGPTE